MGDDKRVDLPGPASSRGEISLSRDHIRVLFALHRARFASCTPSVGDVLVASSETWMGSNEWEQAGKVPPCMMLRVRYGAHISKRILKKWRMRRIITNVIWRLEKTLSRDRMNEFSLLSHQKGSLRGDLIISNSQRKNTWCERAL